MICQLKAMGVEKIVASDFSPGRRVLAQRCGASIVVDPKVDSPYEQAVGKGMVTDFSGLAELGIGSMEKLRKLPGWEYVYRAAEAVGGGGPKRPVIFECGRARDDRCHHRCGPTAVPGGRRRRLHEPDQFRPAMAIGKEIDLRFVFGYTPLEFRDSLHMLADGKLDASPLITGTVGPGRWPARSRHWATREAREDPDRPRSTVSSL